MLRLVFVSLVWALSFGLLKHHLAGIHPDLVNAIRMVLALVVFAPWLRRVPRRLELAGVGALQFGLMYALYNRSFAFLQGHQVALATILTPLYVTLFDDLLSGRLRWRWLASAALSVGGTAICLGAGSVEGSWAGLLLLQAANVCFAVGQVWYRRVLSRSAPASSDAAPMAWAYLGGAGVVAVFALPQLGGLAQIAAPQWLALAWLGVVASGLCFFLWNGGGRSVNTGVLAVMNDLKIPLGVLVSLVAFDERADVPRLLAGSAVVACAWWLASTGAKEEAAPALS